MQKLSRSLFAAAAVIGTLVACDDVSTDVVASRVTSVTVVPATLQISVGGTGTLTATVVGDAGLTDRDVTWTSSDPSVATVDAAGKVTGVKAGQTTIIAASHADPLVKGAASVVVTAQLVPAVSISSITKNGLPIDINNVSGQVDVTLNVAGNGASVNSVDLLVQCPNNTAPVLVQSQSFSGGNAPTGPVTLSFNSAQLNAAGTAAQFQNGACNIVARLTTPAGSPTAADAVRPATFNNADTAIVTVTTPATAADQANREWKGGGAVTVKVVPVIYSNPALVPSSVSVNLSGPLTTGGTLNVTQTATAGTATFPTTGTGNVGGITVEPVTVAVTVVGANNVGLAITQPNVQFRLDNQAPQNGTYTFNTQGTNNQWVGGAFVFNTTAGNGYVAGTTPQGLNDWGGVDRVGAVFSAAPFAAATSQADANAACPVNSAPSSTAQAGLTFTNVSAASALANSPTNTNWGYCLRMVETDALGNAVTRIIGVFGVDKNAPIINTVTPANQSNVTDVTPITINAVDSLSGFNTTGTATNVNGTITRLNTSGTQTCVVGTGTSCAATAMGAAIAAANFTANIVIPSATGGSTTQGYYTFNGLLHDEAANNAPAITRVYLFDTTAPTFTGGVSIPSVVQPGASFSTTPNDNVDLITVGSSVTYGTITLRSPAVTTVGTAFDNTLSLGGTAVTVTPSNLYRQITNAAATTGTIASAVNIRATDAAGNVGVQTAPIPPANSITPSTPFAASGITAFTLTAPAACNPTTAVPCTTNPESVTLSAQVTGPTSTFSNPFAKVDFYYTDATSGELIFIGSSSSATLVDNGTTRAWTFTTSFNPPAGLASGTVLYAFGVNTAGDALYTSAPITIAP